MRARLVLSVLMLVPCVSAAETYLVRADGTGDFATIQAAIDAAVDGDVIELWAGVYTGAGNENISFLDKAVTVRSHDLDAEVAVIEPSPEVNGVSFGSGELAYITIRGGHGLQFHALEMGGTATVRGCIIRDNWSWYSPLVSAYGGTFVDCRFEDNCTNLSAFAYAVGSVIFKHCVFRENQSKYKSVGGAVMASLGPVFEDCMFEGNEAAYAGGAAFSSGGTFRRCRFIGNRAIWAGAIVAMGPTFIENCTFVDSEAAVVGSAIAASYGAVVEIVGCVITGGSILPVGIGPQGGAIHLSCSDLYGNAGGDWVGDVADQLGVDGNISADPLFCDAAAGDFTLRSDSPCLPGNHPDGADCGLIGALEQGCGVVSLEPESWARIKARFRGNAR